MKHNIKKHSQIHEKDISPVNSGVYRVPDFDDRDGFAFAKFDSGNWFFVNWSGLSEDVILSAFNEYSVRDDLTREGVRWFGLRQKS